MKTISSFNVSKFKVYSLLFTANFKRLTTYFKLFTVNRLRPTVYCLLLTAYCLPLTGVAREKGTVEKKKSVIKIYDASGKDQLTLDNQFGQVKVNLWDKNEVRVDITITANSNSDSRAQQFLDGVEIIDKKDGNQISIRTEIQRTNNQNNSWNWGNNKGEKNFVQIDYNVSMPKNMPLTVKNRFGNTSIPVFRAPLVAVTKYGNFSATELVGSKNNIDVAYGKADIQEMLNGNLDIAYSTLELDKANNIVLVNKFGKMKIGEVETLDGRISYSGGRIGTLKGSSKIKLDFSGGFRIDQLLESADNVDIQANYSSVVIPMDKNDCHFDVTVSYGGFKYPADRKVTFSQNDDDRDDSRHGYRSTKQYVGKLGNGGRTKLKVVSKFGEVSLR
jgi:hypothetical protein